VAIQFGRNYLERANVQINSGIVLSSTIVSSFFFTISLLSDLAGTSNQSCIFTLFVKKITQKVIYF